MGGVSEIVTEGSGWVEQPADRAELTVVFEARGRKRAAAVEALGERVAAAEKALGLPGLTVLSRRVSVHTEYRSNRPSGARAAEFVQVRITDLGVLEEAMSLLLGAEPASFTGPSWSLAEPEAILAQAQQQAVADARRRAEGYAAALGGRLGSLVRLAESAGHPTPMALTMRARGAAEGGPDVSDLGLDPEPVRVEARCTTTWTLISD
jgi:uncharacterized protein YggE